MINVSIIIPVKNGLKWLRNSIPLFLAQRKIDNIELVLLDSGSDDGINEYITKLPQNQIIVHQIRSGEFNHGATRNFGVKIAKYDIVVFSVQDAIPIDNNWLISLIHPIINLGVDASCGAQCVVADLNKNPVEWFKPIDGPQIKIISPSDDQFSDLNPFQRRGSAGWDNVNAAYKRNVLIGLPFREVIFGEDAYWAVDAMKCDLKIAYTSYSRVDHYHHYTRVQLKNRYLAEFYLKKQLYELDPTERILKFRTVLSWFNSITKATINPKEIYIWMKYNFLLHSAFNESVRIFNSISVNELLEYLSVNRTISTSNSK